MKLSIISVNLNNKEGLSNTINSILNQSFKNLELLIIDGGSTDGSLEVIHRYSSKIFYWISEPDSGIYSAMNKGIKQSSAEYILFLNSGDTLISDSILSEIFQENYSEEILSGKACIYNEQISKKTVFAGPDPSELTLSELLRVSLNHQATFIKRKLFDEYNLYDESYQIISDWIFFLKTLIFENVSFRFLNKTIAALQPHGVSMSSSDILIERERALKELIPERIYKDYERYDFQGFKRIKQNRLSWFVYLIAKKIAFL